MELAEIRRIWVVEKHEIEDLLPEIYEDELGVPYPHAALATDTPFSATDLAELRCLCGDDSLHYELTRNLLAISWQYRSHLRRAGIFGRIDDAIRRGFFRDERDATDRARRRDTALTRAKHSAANDFGSPPTGQFPLLQLQRNDDGDPK